VIIHDLDASPIAMERESAEDPASIAEGLFPKRKNESSSVADHSDPDN
jgi:hypothetical protein